MTPTDATNLLLGLMYDDAQEAAFMNVPRLRDAELTSFRGRLGFDFGGGDAGHVPTHDFISAEGEPLKLGEVLDSMLDSLVRYGSLDAEPGEGAPTSEWPHVSNISVSVSRPGYAARIWIDAVSVHWTLAYTWRDPEDEARRAVEAARGEMPSHALAHLGTFMSRTRSIADEELTGLADVLRGTSIEFDDQDAEVVPPYDAHGARA